MSDSKFRCLCGQIISVPLPKRCPGCGKTIRGVRMASFKLVIYIASIFVMFGLLLLLVMFLVNAI